MSSQSNKDSFLTLLLFPFAGYSWPVIFGPGARHGEHQEKEFIAAAKSHELFVNFIGVRQSG